MSAGREDLEVAIVGMSPITENFIAASIWRSR